MSENDEISAKLALGVVVVLLFVALIALFCVVLVRLYRRKARQYVREKVDRERLITAAVLDTQRQLLETVARDLHDDVGQQLTVLNLGIEKSRLDAPGSDDMLQPLSEAVAKVAESVRMISHTLGSLASCDLPEAIRSEAARIERYSGIVITFREGAPAPAVAEAEKNFLYRVFQEGINNTMKHAKARNVIITLDAGPPVTFTLSDDGAGFDTSDTGRKSFGLDSMTARAERMGYRLSVNSVPNQGTTITAVKR